MTTPFHNLSDFIALPRVDGIAVSPDGARVVMTVSALRPDRQGSTRAIWQVPTSGDGIPSRLTRSGRGERGIAFTRTGDLLFVSARPDAEADKDSDAAQLWVLPAVGGEARALTRLAGGIDGILSVARDTDRVAITAPLLPGVAQVPGREVERDAELRTARDDRGVVAILHETYPVRFWDHDLGPDRPHVLTLDLDQAPTTATAVPGPNASEDGRDAPAYPADVPRPRVITPDPGRTLDHVSGSLTPDGAAVIASVQVQEQLAGRFALVSIDTTTGVRTTLREEDGFDNELPVVSHDGGSIAWTRSAHSTPDGPSDAELWVANLDGSDARRIATTWDRWASEYTFDTDGRALIAVADQDGRAPVFRIPIDGGAVEQLTDDDFAYSGIQVAAQAGTLVALRGSWAAPLHPVRIDRDGTVTTLPTPAPLPDLPGRLEEVETIADDGTRVRGWLVLPKEATAPSPLLLWIHGGPLNSWNQWSWRWNPMIMAARGYAVLLPDPALSTGYGLDFIARGWNAWGGAPFTDLMAITDTVEARPDIDETRTAAMGGSFGGYMANWVAGHTDRFRAIVTHASLWALDQFVGTTDDSSYWLSIFNPEGLHESDPHRFVADIATPMLVIHGDHDYRVPIGEGLRLWSELAAHHAAADGTMPHRFLYFPNENHWVLQPQHAEVWYETVLAFLAVHVLGEEWQRPDLLG